MQIAFLKLLADSTMDENTMLGLMMAMTALENGTGGHVAVFVSDLTLDARRKILGLFRYQLKQIFSDLEVCTWLAEFPA